MYFFTVTNVKYILNKFKFRYKIFNMFHFWSKIRRKCSVVFLWMLLFLWTITTRKFIFWKQKLKTIFFICVKNFQNNIFLFIRKCERLKTSKTYIWRQNFRLYYKTMLKYFVVLVPPSLGIWTTLILIWLLFTSERIDLLVTWLRTRICKMSSQRVKLVFTKHRLTVSQVRTSMTEHWKDNEKPLKFIAFRGAGLLVSWNSCPWLK